MTRLTVDYAHEEIDPLDLMTPDELEIERALQWARIEQRARQQKAKEFDEEAHPRDEHGRFTSGDGAAPEGPPGTQHLFPVEPYIVAPAIPTSTTEAYDTYIEGIHRFQDRMAERGGPTTYITDPAATAEGMNVDLCNVEAVAEDERARCEAGVAAFLDEPRLQGALEAYGRPEFVIAGGLARPDDAEGAGEDPADYGVLAQWSNGTVFLYGDMAGREDPRESEMPGWGAGPATLESTMEHEYGHQVAMMVGWEADGTPSPMMDGFVSSLIGFDVRAGGYDTRSEEEVGNYVAQSAGQISGYAEQAGAEEAFAEAFVTVMQPDFDIERFDDGARDALELLVGQLKQDGAL